jgi:hypothetical protein
MFNILIYLGRSLVTTFLSTSSALASIYSTIWCIAMAYRHITSLASNMFRRFSTS